MPRCVLGGEIAQVCLLLCAFSAYVFSMCGTRAGCSASAAVWVRMSGPVRRGGCELRGDIFYMFEKAVPSAGEA
ncbi:MAG: hypothetical protein DBX55_00145 [Verrucomicrobia bacterium]|nr:MAG: hypothetical protein DBX55_00145 [Verrucomicrobiota bacterium]